MFWKKKQEEITRDVDKAKCDSTSLGSLLLEFNHISQRDLDAAIAFQENNQDKFLGEALVSLGKIDRDLVDIMLTVQKNKRGEKRDFHAIMSAIKKQEKRLTIAHNKLQLAAGKLTEI